MNSITRPCGVTLSAIVLIAVSVTLGVARAIAAPPSPQSLAVPAGFDDRTFQTSDGVRLHYLEGGDRRAQARTIVFVPGWTMPARIWSPQLHYFASDYRVIALDPRSQGDSQIAKSGHEHGRRGGDIAELIEHLRRSGQGEPVVLAGWSLGVLDSLAYVAAYGDRRVASLVLVDNSVGEEPPPVVRFNLVAALRKDRETTVRNFVRSMYAQPADAAYLEEVSRLALRTPLGPAIELLSYPVPREYWRNAIYSTDRPVLYAVTSRFSGQAENLRKKHRRATAEVFATAGHALFIDEAMRFNRLMDEFLKREVWRDGASAPSHSAPTSPGSPS